MDSDLDSEQWLKGCDYIVNANKLAVLLSLPLKYILGTYVQINTHAQLHKQHTHTQADSTDRGLIGVSVSGWADLNCPRGLVPGRETDGGLGSPMYFPRFPLTRSYCDSRSANPTSTPFTPAHTHTHATHIPLQPHSAHAFSHCTSCLGLWVE